jgi:hypothetical protein
VYAVWCGDLEESTAILAEYDAVNEATGIVWFSAGGLLQAAYQGRAEALALMETSRAQCVAHGVGQGAQFATWMKAIVFNGLGRYADALAAAQTVAAEMEMPTVTGWALPEVIEAAVRNRQPAVAESAIEHLSRHTLADSDWATGIEARSRALVSEGDEAERSYAEALARLGRTPFRTELARGPPAVRRVVASERAGASTHVSSLGRRTRCSPRWVPRGSPSGRVVSFWRQARR